jgi:hypothetical protein
MAQNEAPPQGFPICEDGQWLLQGLMGLNKVYEALPFLVLK